MKGTHPKNRDTKSCSLQGEIVVGWGQGKCRYTELLAGERVQQLIREHVKYLEKRRGLQHSFAVELVQLHVKSTYCE